MPALVRYELEVHLARPVAEAFAYVADPDRIREWETDYVDFACEPGPKSGKGARFAFKRRVGGRVLAGRLEQVDEELDRRLSYRGIGGPIVPAWTFHFSPEGEGTRLVEHFTAEIAWPLGLFAPLLRPILKKGSQAALDRLSARLARPPSARAA